VVAPMLLIFESDRKMCHAPFFSLCVDTVWHFWLLFASRFL
jgi:hypothetical protein